MIERIYILCLIIIIKSEVWAITHCLGLGHDTMVCAVCLSVFSLKWSNISCQYYSIISITYLRAFAVYLCYVINRTVKWFVSIHCTDINLNQWCFIVMPWYMCIAFRCDELFLPEILDCLHHALSMYYVYTSWCDHISFMCLTLLSAAHDGGYCTDNYFNFLDLKYLNIDTSSKVLKKCFVAIFMTNQLSFRYRICVDSTTSFRVNWWCRNSHNHKKSLGQYDLICVLLQLPSICNQNVNAFGMSL